MQMDQNYPRKKHWTRRLFINSFLAVAGIGIISFGFILIAVARVNIPDFQSFDERKVAKSTKIYDRTGEVALYDVNDGVKRTVIPFTDMGAYIKNATVAIEDSAFYQHKGISVRGILRSVWVNIQKGGLAQGGSTITQQIVKNTLLNSDKTITRKLKEWILSLKVEKALSKEDILGIYLNEVPYGGSIYGVEEASKKFFGKDAGDLTLAEAAYIAAIPKAPTYYSPYGKNKDKLDERKNTVLARMKELNFITQEEYDKAAKEAVTFKPAEPVGIKAPHFVFYIKEYLEQKYGADAVESGGLKVITTLDYNLQQKAEEITREHALQNEKDWNGKNAALVSIDPKTGQILAMVGSRDYFDKQIDGNFNVATANRQPGSSFKPFIYLSAFEKGYTPDTVVFDLPFEFQSTCDAYGKALPGHSQTNCYHPQNYDDKNRGPMTLRDALAQSINVPAVEMLYLVGVSDAIKTARDMGIHTLTDASRYGLTLVIGGGEVSLLDITSAYGVFAQEGVRHPYASILKVEDANGNILEQYTDQSQQVVERDATLQVSSILSDNQARIPTFGAHSPLEISGREVAVKTGTTNNNKDAWTVGYTPSIVTGVWVGNNDNTPMKKGGAALAGPIWHDFMSYALQKLPDESFTPPPPVDPSLKPILRGSFLGNETFTIDTVSGKLATEATPPETRLEKSITNVHNILYWVDKNDPTGPAPTNPEKDSQYERWETLVQQWWTANRFKYPQVTEADIPTQSDDIHTADKAPTVTINTPVDNATFTRNSHILVTINSSGAYQFKKADIFVNNEYVGTIPNVLNGFTFTPDDVSSLAENNELKVISYDATSNSGQAIIHFSISDL